jgi:hypothetical protein
MRFLGPAYRSLTGPGGKPTREQFARVFEQTAIAEEDFTRDTFPPGSAGASALYNRLMFETNTLP